MNNQQLRHRLKGGEWDDFEVKEARTALPKDVWKTVSAFANTAGGHIVFGAKEDNGAYTITGVEKPGRLQNDFVSTLRGEWFIAFCMMWYQVRIR